MWSLLTLLSVINMAVVPSVFAACVILINISVMVQQYRAHKCMRAEYDRQYPPTFDNSTHELKEKE